MKIDRRNFLSTTNLLGVIAIVVHPISVQSEDEDSDKKNKDHSEEEISAPEDLMREHGVLNRILLVYEEGIRRLRSKEDVPPQVFLATAHLVRKFVEDYHEKLEEKFIFTEFEKQKKLVELVTVLRAQHDAGRKITDTILRNAAADQFPLMASHAEIIRSCEAFIRMYRPHEAREDTILFPALRKIIPKSRIAELGEQFEQEEERLFGDEGFEKTVEQVAVIEKQLGIYELGSFTPK